jgi:SAM-dependent methyltransferase
MYFQQKTELFRGHSKRMLHVAPENCFEPRLKRRLGANYLTADLHKEAMIQMDIANIQFPDQSFDVVYCSHVLEHVPDDRKAMREFYRVLKNDGWAILLVPITAEKTFEDPSVDKPEDRLRLFGQSDHVRRYGRDYVDRLREAGFHVNVADVSDLFGEREAIRMGLTDASGEIYFCTKKG